MSIVDDRQRWKLRAEKAEAEIELLRSSLEQLLDAHWPLVESADHEDENCRRARSALEQETRK